MRELEAGLNGGMLPREFLCSHNPAKTQVNSCDTATMPPVFGHHRAIQTLTAAIDAGRMHHAWIFSGPTGIGKFLLAKETGAILIEGRAAKPLGTGLRPDSNCGRLLASESHPDLHVIHRKLAALSSNPSLRERKQMNIPLDLLRETMLGGRTSDGRIHEAAAYRTPALSDRKVFIINEAELLDASGQNALLKTLEEPPSETYIFLVTNRPERLLPTIWSRCQHLPMAPLEPSEMQSWMRETAFEAEGDDLELILDFAEGSPGMAFMAHDRNALEWIRSLNPLLQNLDQGQWSEGIATGFFERIDAYAKAVVSENPKSSKSAANLEACETMLRIIGRHERLALRRATDVNVMVRHCGIIDRIADAEQQMQSGLNLKHVLEGLTAEWAGSSS